MDILETNRQVIDQFRAGGEIPGMQRDRLLLLTTTGARTGRQRTSPMMFHREGERLFVIGSNMGAPHDPSWCVNLRATPRVTVETGDERYAATAQVLGGADREGVWDRIRAAYPFFVDHEEAAGSREIPVVELVRTVA